MLAILPLVLTLAAVIHDIDDFGASRADASAVHVNAAAFESALAASNPGDTVRISPGLPYYMQKVQAASVRGVTISIEGELRIDSNFTAWGTLSKHLTFINLADSTNVTFTGGGLIDGQGMPWWDASITGSTPNLGEHRPNMFHFTNVTDLIIEHLNLKNSPHFHLYFTQCARVTIRFVTIDVDRFAQRKLKARAHAKRIASLGAPWAGRADDISRRIYALAPAGTATGTGFGAAATSSQDWRDAILDELVKLLPAWVLQPEDLNTDGIDPNGRDFHVHDTAINNDDDSIAVKPSDGADTYPCSENMLFERMTMTGFGASIGSVPPHANGHCVRNITFRDVAMPGTGKGIYIKSNPSCGLAVDKHNRTVQKTSLITAITYENVVLDKPWWWAIWIGPQQQHEPGSDLGSKCALDYPITDHCPTQGCATFSDITLRNVTVNDPLLSPGVVLGNASNPMRNIVFDGVKVAFSKDPLRGAYPWGRKYLCQHADVKSIGGTAPPVECS